MKKIGFLLLLQCCVVFAWGQYSLKGVVTGNNELLPGASVVIQGTFRGISAKSNGVFEFSGLKKGRYLLSVSFISYQEKQVVVDLSADKFIKVDLTPDTVLTDEVLVSATRAKDKTPVAYSSVSKEELENKNMGQDIPYLLQLTPSFVTTSDAGTGVGYTNFRIRGTDLNRINVCIDGIPVSEAETHGTWFVDMPDIASSLENIQVQRGIGTSANGAAAFGGTIDLQTSVLKKEAYASYHTAAGSFHTFKNTISAGTGLINDKFTFDVRLSQVSSDGFIDRATSDLKSFFVSGGYYSTNTILKINVFSGLEETYQAWWGVPSVRLNNDMKGMKRYEEHGLYTAEETEAMIHSNSRTYNYYTYENQIDHYQQDYYHLHFSHQFNEALHLNMALHYRHGKGYYENYKKNKKFSKYKLACPVVGKDTLKKSNFVTQKWLDNDFYGIIFSLNYKKERVDFTLGGGGNTYDGDHYGKVIWGQYLGNVDTDYEWYRGNGLKKDFNIYGKLNYRLTGKLNLFADLQYRRINYKIKGIDDDLRAIGQKHNFDFFNPKLGVYFQPEERQKVYFSFATGHREPNRDNYVDADPDGKQPVSETLYDWEAGYSFRSSRFSADANLYFMNYNDQLVLTGKINDVGAPIMVNVEDSYRAGLELQLGWKITPALQCNVNVTFSRNKIRNFTEYVDDMDTWKQKSFNLGTTDLAFSPKFTGNSQLVFSPLKNLKMSFISQYVGKQYIDNTSSNDRVLDAYFVNNLRVDYKFAPKFVDEIDLHVAVSNLFDEEYESNAWVYSYFYGGKRFKQDGYFPQSGINFMLGLDVKF